MSKTFFSYLAATLVGILIARYALPANGNVGTKVIESDASYDTTTYIENDYDPVALIERLDETEVNYRSVKLELEQLKLSLETKPTQINQQAPAETYNYDQLEQQRNNAAEAIRQYRRNSSPAVQREILLNHGFNETELQTIEQAKAEYEQKQLENRILAMRENPENYQNVLDPLGYQSIREALGDERFEEYLTALGRDTSVNTRSVTPGSAAERAGIKAGDEIYSYDGSRVFQSGDVTRGTISGNPGENVIVEVLRDGAVVPLTVERGALGVTLSNAGRGGRGGGGRGNR